MRRTLPAVALLTCCSALGAPPALGASPANAATPPIRHVFVIVLENEGVATTFGPGSPAPYLSQTLRAQGAFLPKYYGTGHNSNDNYIAMISGQAPNLQSQADCLLFDDFLGTTIGSYGQVQGTGCVYPASVPTIAGQLTAAGLTWRDYNEGMGATPSREASVCGHPGIGSMDNTQTATAADQYATRHNPFVYFHSIIDDTTLCDTHVVGLDLLPADLASAANTPNYVFITPNLCNDGHDATCANGGPGGLPAADAFLRTWVPRITSSPAFKQENGLLVITFDESSVSDTGACCGEIAGPGSPLPGLTGPGGGDTGTVLLSPCIAPGTVSNEPYNHYTMLRSVEDLFGLGHLGYVGLPGERSFGSDVFTGPCGAAQAPRLRVPPLASRAAHGPRVLVRWAGASPFMVQVRKTSFGRGRWRTVLSNSSRRALTFNGSYGETYVFRVRSGSGPWASATTVIPTDVSIPGGRFRGTWAVHRVGGAWGGRVIVGSGPGSTLTLTFVGGSLQIVGSRWPRGGRAEVVLDRRAQTVDLSRRPPRSRTVVFSRGLRPGRHRLKITVLSGVVPIEGLAITSRQR
jgi:hypothetical protein